MLLRWGGCSRWTARNTENQQNSEILSHRASWTGPLQLLKSVLRAHHLNSAKYLKGNLLLLFIVCLVLLVSFSFYGNYLAKCNFLFICLRARRTETGSKSEHSKHKLITEKFYKGKNVSIVMLSVALFSQQQPFPFLSSTPKTFRRWKNFAFSLS